MELAKEKRGHFLYRLFYPKKIFLTFVLYSVFNTLSEYAYFYISKNITSYKILLVFKIVESLQCVLKPKSSPKYEVLKILQNSQEIPALESLHNQPAALCFFKTRILVNFAKLLATYFYRTHLGNSFCIYRT